MTLAAMKEKEVGGREIKSQYLGPNWEDIDLGYIAVYLIRVLNYQLCNCAWYLNFHLKYPM